MLKKITIFGVQGKMNNALVEVAKNENILIERFKRVEEIKDIRSDIIIDFSIPEAVFSHFQIAQKYNIPILICTTGHKELEFLKDTCIPACYAPNTCVQWLIIKKCATEIENSNRDTYVVIDDIHSSTKRDAPSGTSLNLVETLKRPNEIIRSIRGPEVSSWHKISFYNKEQVIHLEHQVLDRKVYAKGAIELARKLSIQPPGLYKPEDLLHIGEGA